MEKEEENTSLNQNKKEENPENPENPEQNNSQQGFSRNIFGT